MTVQHPCAALFDSVGQDDVVFAELVDMFLDDAPPRVEAIRLAIESGDASTVAREAHTYKGAAVVLDAKDVASCAHELELLARSGNLAGAREIAARLEVHSKSLFNVIRRFRAAFPFAAVAVPVH